MCAEPMTPSTHAPGPPLATFYALVVTQTFSLIGSRMTAVALGIWVFTTTGQTTPLLLTAFFNELPGMLGGSLAGVLVDRYDRKAIMILADVGQAAGSLLLLASFSSGAFQLWHLYVVAFVQGLFATFQGPAERATLTLMVPTQQRERANGLVALAFPLASLLAPILTGLIYTSIGVMGVIVADLGTFVVAALVVAALKIPRPPVSTEGQASRGSLLAELRGGVRFLRQRPPLLIFLLYLTFINFLLNGPLELQIPYLVAITGSEARVGLGLAAASLGAMAGAGLMTVLGGYRPRLRLILIGSMLCGLMFLVLGTARSLPLVSVALFLVILPLPANGALFVSLLQTRTSARPAGPRVCARGSAGAAGLHHIVLAGRPASGPCDQTAGGHAPLASHSACAGCRPGRRHGPGAGRNRSAHTCCHAPGL